MKPKTSNTRGAFSLALLMILAVAAPILTSAPAFAQSQADSSNPLVGLWIVQVTLTDCATGDPLPGAPFTSLVTFNHAGTVAESTGALGFAPGQRSTGHGTWTHIGGRTYLQRMMALINFATPPNLPSTPGFNPALPIGPGFFAGTSIVNHKFTLIDADHASSYGTNEFFKTNGESYRSGCSTAVAVRFK
ncbi:MAG TPA: hypothetical protein VN577_22820 [Terriglobales bacterium]|nr:hypothetical protein [Terriglobales bacterium]